jgi:hypothetical protein
MRPRDGPGPEGSSKTRADKEDVVADQVLNLDHRALVRLFPAFRLFAAIRLAFDIRKLAIAALGLALLQLGWSLIDSVFPTTPTVTPDVWRTVGPIRLENHAGGSWAIAAELNRGLSEPARALAAPLFAVLDFRSSWRTMAHALLSLVWLIVIWGLCGGAIARIATVQVAMLRQPGLGEALKFSFKSAGSLIVAPLCPLLVLAFCAAFAAGFGLLYRLPGAGPALAGFGLVIPLALGLIMMLVAAGLVAGWPLLHAAVAAGADDALDAVSRTLGYLNQRLGAFMALLVFAWLEGIIGLMFVVLLTEGLLGLTQWGLGLTAPAGLLTALFDAAGSPGGAVVTATHAFWVGVVRLAAHGWAYSFFWTAAALIYLWLRHDVDGTPWSEIEARGAP